jgi:hypothetical protein
MGVMGRVRHDMPTAGHSPIEPRACGQPPTGRA